MTVKSFTHFYALNEANSPSNISSFDKHNNIDQFLRQLGLVCTNVYNKYGYEYTFCLNDFKDLYDIIRKADIYYKDEKIYYWRREKKE